MNPIYEKLYKAGYMIIVDHDKQDQLQHYYGPAFGLMKVGGPAPTCYYGWDLFLEVAQNLIRELEGPKQTDFSVTVRYNRGLGPEHIVMDKVAAISFEEAKEKAHAQAVSYFQNTPGFENASVLEVQVRPA